MSGRRLLRGLVALAAACGLVALNGPTLVSAGRDALHDYKVNSPGYKAEHGHWSMLSVPEDMRVNAIHAALMETARGRAFLAEYARRNRRADIGALLAASERIEATMREQRAAEPAAAASSGDDAAIRRDTPWAPAPFGCCSC